MHLVEIDPPYAIDLKQAKKFDGVSQYVTNNYNEIPADEYQVFLAKLLSECYRVMAPHSWLIFWFAPEPWFEIVYQEIKSAGFSTTRMCGCWVKSTGQSKRPEIYLANSYELFFYAWKGRPTLNKPGRTNIFQYPPIPPNQKTHETERPIELTTDIYETFTPVGSRVLIPFLGSGNGLISAHKLGMSAVGFELGKSYKDSFIVKVDRMFKN
jgi:DNA modification methylase